MHTEEFNRIASELIRTSEKIMVGKANEYNEDTDRLGHFVRAAALAGTTPQQAMGGMMLKHTVSVYDMIRDPENTHTLEKWDEKIVDHINYLLILKAIVVEAQKDLCESDLKEPIAPHHLIEPKDFNL